MKAGFKRDDVAEVLAKGGKLSFGEALRCRVRYLTDGLVFGGREFVDSVFMGAKDYFGKKRESGARAIREVGWQEKKDDRLYSMRALKKEVVE